MIAHLHSKQGTVKSQVCNHALTFAEKGQIVTEQQAAGLKSSLKSLF